MKKILLSVLALAAVCSCVKDNPYVAPDPGQGTDPEPQPVEIAQTLLINELAPAVKKLEFYNNSDNTIDIGGCTLTKDDSDIWEFPPMELAPRAVVVFTAKSSDPTQGPNFGMSATKGFKLELKNKKGETIDLVDNSKGTEKFFEFVDEAESLQTLGRETDGAAQWVIFSVGTIGESNKGGTKDKDWGAPEPEPEIAMMPKTLVLNELAPAIKKIEFYNNSDETIDIGGYTLTKDDSDIWEMPMMDVAPGAVVVFTAKSANAVDGPGFGMSATKGFKLELKNKAGDTIDLLDNSKGTDNFYSFVDDAESKETLGREIDGAVQWVIFNPGTIGESNKGGTKVSDYPIPAVPPAAE